jgi:hypothetical protein
MRLQDASNRARARLPVKTPNNFCRLSGSLLAIQVVQGDKLKGCTVASALVPPLQPEAPHQSSGSSTVHWLGHVHNPLPWCLQGTTALRSHCQATASRPAGTPAQSLFGTASLQASHKHFVCGYPHTLWRDQQGAVVSHKASRTALKSMWGDSWGLSTTPALKALHRGSARLAEEEPGGLKGAVVLDPGSSLQAHGKLRTHMAAQQWGSWASQGMPGTGTGGSPGSSTARQCMPDMVTWSQTLQGGA